MHGIIVVCHNLLSCGILYRPSFSGCWHTSFSILIKMFLHLYTLGSELWEYDIDDLLSLLKEYVVVVWDVCKQNLYSDDS